MTAKSPPPGRKAGAQEHGQAEHDAHGAWGPEGFRVLEKPGAVAEKNIRQRESYGKAVENGPFIVSFPIKNGDFP